MVVLCIFGFIRKTSMSNAIKTMNFIKEYLSTLGFLLNGNSQVQVISGKEEAINAWISANYIEQNFKEHKTNGVMDLGGGSTQIIFVPCCFCGKVLFGVKIG